MAVFSETIELKDKVSPAAAAAAREASILEKAVLAAQNALVKAGAAGGVNGNAYKKLALNVKQYQEALSVLPKAELAEYDAARKALAASKEEAAAKALAAKNESIAAKKAVADKKAVDAAAALVARNNAKASREAIASQKTAEAAVKRGAVEAKRVIAEKKRADAEAKAKLDEFKASSAESMSSMVAWAEAAVAATAVAVGFAAAIGGLVYMGAKFAIEASQDKIKTEQLFAVLSEGVNTGSEVADTLEALAYQMGVSKGQAEETGKAFMKMGITDLVALQNVVLASTSSFALLGEGGADAFEKLEKKIQITIQTGEKLKIPLKGLGSLAEMGLTVADVASKMGISAKKLGAELKAGTADAAKFGDALETALIEKGAGPLERMGVQLSSTWKIFKDQFADLFEDVDVTPFLVQVKDLFSVFSQAKPSGQALKAGITGFFTDTFKAAAPLVLVVKHFFLDLIIWSLEAYIALKPIQKWFLALEQNKPLMNTLSLLFKSFSISLGIVAVAAGVLVTVFGGIIAGALALIGYITYLELDIVDGFAKLAAKAIQFGIDFVGGLVNGIVNGGAAVIGAVQSLAGKAKDAFKATLGIHSPSTVMYELGMNVAAGAAGGIQAGAGDVANAGAGLAGGAVAGFSGGAAGGGAGGGSKVEVHANFSFNGSAGTGGEALELTEQAVTLIFEKVALQLGL